MESIRAITASASSATVKVSWAAGETPCPGRSQATTSTSLPSAAPAWFQSSEDVPSEGPTIRRGFSPSGRWGESRTALTVGLATGSSVSGWAGGGTGRAGGEFRVGRENPAGDGCCLAEVVGRVQKLLNPCVGQQ